MEELAHIVGGHVSRERFLDLLEERGYTCDVEHVRYGYMSKVLRQENVLLPVPPGQPVTFTLRGHHLETTRAEE